jgi:acyl carrier protein
MGLDSVELVMAVEEEFDSTLTDPIHALGMD